jgi:hypothetical protein
MKKRPTLLTILSLLVFGIAISFPIQIMVRFGIPPTEPGAVADKLAPLNWFSMAIGLILSGLIMRASALARLLAPVFILIIAWNNWLVANLDTAQNGDIALLGTLLVLTAMSVLLLPEIRRVMTHPNLRWWLTPPRKKVELATRVRPSQGGAELRAHTFDLSEGGVFIALDPGALNPRTMRTLPVGSHCAVTVDLPEHRISSIARVVRHAEARGTYPSGFAVTFENMQSEDRARLRQFMKSYLPPVL